MPGRIRDMADTHRGHLSRVTEAIERVVAVAAAHDAATRAAAQAAHDAVHPGPNSTEVTSVQAPS